MWQLISTTNGGEKFPLFVDAENIVGRKDCSIVLKNDAAISRKHAMITVTHPDNHVSHSHLLPTIKVKDMSKYGTYVNQKRIGEEVLLKSGDSIKFGSEKSKFSLKYEPFIVTTSCLNPAVKKSVKGIIRKIGGHVVPEWQKDCCMVVMSNLNVTIKVMCALMSCGNVVTPEYLKRLFEALQSKGEKPEPTDFLPPLAESQINPDEVSFGVEPSRQILFQGKMFIFLTSKQFKKLNLAIELGGGVPILMEEGSDDNDDSVLTAPGTCVMECGPTDINSQQLSQNAQEWISHVMDYLQKLKKRPIPETELVFAALYSSTDKYCNPDVNNGGLTLGSGGAIPGATLSQQINPYPSQSMAYAADTEPSQVENKHQPTAQSKPSTSHFKEPVRVKEEPVSQVPVAEEAVQEQEMTTNSRKRAREEEEVERERKQKQVKVEHRSRSKSPSPVPRESKRERRNTSPAGHTDKMDDNENEIDFDSVPTRQGRRENQRKRSPVWKEVDKGDDFDDIPARSGQERKSRKRSPVADDVGDFDSVPPRASGRRTSPRKKSPSPCAKKDESESVPQKVVGRTSRKKSPSPAPDAADDLFNFDSIPRRKASRKSRRLDESPDIDAEGLFQNNPKNVILASDDGARGFDDVPPRKGARQTRKDHTLSPSPEKKRTRQASRSPHSDDGAGGGFDDVPPRKGARQTRKDHSLSPSPEKKRTRQASRSPHSDDGAGGGFDDVPPRKGARQGRNMHALSPSPEKKQTRSPSPGKRQTRQSRSRSPSPGRSRKDDFDDIPTRKGGKPKKLSSNETEHSDVNQNGSVTGKKDKVKKESITYVPETMETDFDNLGNVDFDSRDGPNITTVPETEDIDAASPRRAGAKMKREPAWSPPSPAPESTASVGGDAKPSTSRNVSPRRLDLNSAPAPGYLSAMRPAEIPTIKTEENQLIPDLPKACAAVSYTSLVVRRQKPTKPGSTMPQSWKGNPVKNFKKFKKVQHRGSDDLPRVIGGRDLVTHANVAKKQMMEKFAADLQMTQHEEDDDYQDLFNAVRVPERKVRGRKN